MVVSIVHLGFNVYVLMMIANIISSWIPEIRDHRIMQFVRFYTEPYLNFFRRIIPPLGMIDLSPIVGLFALQFLEQFVVGLLR